jgi:hypothetical protein
LLVNVLNTYRHGIFNCWFLQPANR